MSSFDSYTRIKGLFVLGTTTTALATGPPSLGTFPLLCANVDNRQPLLYLVRARPRLP